MHNLAQLYFFIFAKLTAKDPLKDALLIFTVGSSNSRAVYVVNGEGHVVQTEFASAQTVKLQAVAIVFQLLANRVFNLYTDR